MKFTSNKERGNFEVFSAQTCSLTKTSRVRGGSVAIPRRALARSRLAVVCSSVQLSEHTQSCPSVQSSQARTQSERACFVTAQDMISSRQPFFEAVMCLCRVFFWFLECFRPVS